MTGFRIETLSFRGASLKRQPLTAWLALELKHYHSVVRVKKLGFNRVTIFRIGNTSILWCEFKTLGFNRVTVFRIGNTSILWCEFKTLGFKGVTVFRIGNTIIPWCEFKTPGFNRVTGFRIETLSFRGASLKHQPLTAWLALELKHYHSVVRV